jgi:hypothetical protein
MSDVGLYESRETIPVELDGIDIYERGGAVKNPFSGEVVELDGLALSIYDAIKGAEAFQQYGIVRAGCDWFRQFEPEAYMKLLD